jgi:transposase-like protein
MASTRITRRWTAAEAERVVEAWRESGQSMSAFARQRGFDVQRLAWWKKRFAEWSGDHEHAARFAPAVISTTSGPRVSVRLDEGILIEVADVLAVPPAWLSELVSGLRGRR